MVKKIALNDAKLILENDRTISLIVRDKSLPRGFKSPIKDSLNYGQALKHFQEKYPELEQDLSLPLRAVLPETAPSKGVVNLGVTYNEVPMTFNFHGGFPHLRIIGRPGVGKTCLALTIAHQFKRFFDSQLTMITDRPDEYSSVKDSSRTLWIDPQEENAANKLLESFENKFTTTQGSKFEGEELLIVDSSEVNEDMKRVVERILRLGRSLGWYAIYVSQHEHSFLTNNTQPIYFTNEHVGRAVLGEVEFQVGIPTIY